MKDKLKSVYFISNFEYDEFVKYIKEINIWILRVLFFENVWVFGYKCLLVN